MEAELSEEPPDDPVHSVHSAPNDAVTAAHGTRVIESPYPHQLLQLSVS